MNIGLIGPGEIGAVIVKKLRDALSGENGKFERARLTQEACSGKEALVTYSQRKRAPLRAGMPFFVAVAMATVLSACRKGDAPPATPPAAASPDPRGAQPPAQ